MGEFLSSKFMETLFGGLAFGVTYSLVALSLVIIWRSTHVLNFAQGAMAMIAAYIGLTQVDRHVNFWICVLISLAAGFLIGGLTERVLVRPLYGKPEINPIVVMVGFLGLIEAGTTAIWGSQPRSIAAPFSQVYYSYRGRAILLSPYVFFEIGVAVAIMIAISMLFRFTNIGLKLRAAASAPEVARLLGVRVNRMLTLGWILASGVGVMTAIVVETQGPTLTPTIMDPIFVSGFIAAAIGGLESPVGAVTGGITLGIITQFVLNYWSNNASILTPLVVLIVVLMIRPQGLFTRHADRRV